MPKKRTQFRKAFSKGSQSYDTWLGDWWLEQSSNRAHKRAYENIAAYIHTILRKTGRPQPRFLVDYACGSAGSLRAFAKSFPKTRFIGLDGSEKLLSKAKTDLNQIGCDAEFVSPDECFREKGPRARLVHTALPTPFLPAGKADVVVFLFPNMNPTEQEMVDVKKQYRPDPATDRVARLLSTFPEEESEGENSPQDAADIYETLLYERAISNHIHKLLTRKGLLFKGDYANASRETLLKLVQWKLLFSESALDIQEGRKRKLDKFEYLGNKFFRSSILSDLYYQVPDPAYKKGGFFISQLQRR